ncbi:Ltp family lipoprotein [Eubacterium callanderi]|uniref:Ltp family lipoprotein n=1 Tax=Eubacterium callanderi TaxID=53442 RepID=A0A853JUT2_9FIRM|nr:Ltp family lipoprotein [Eubacterium callanderi]
MKRKFALFLAILFLTIAFSGCSSTSDPKDIVGVWKRDNSSYDEGYDNVMQFNEDGTFLNAHLKPGEKWTLSNPWSSGTYTYNGSELTMYYNDSYEGASCKVTNGKMDLKFYSTGSKTMFFYKTSDSIEEITGLNVSDLKQPSTTIPTPEPTPSPVQTAPAPTPEPTVTMTVGQKNALDKAKRYLRSSSFSYTKLIEQLEYEQFTTEDATFAVDNCGADWNEQAAKKAQQYMNSSSFSRDRLLSQLEYEGFTPEQAEYGATSVGY